MKILVTGATGFIGHALCAHLHDLGHSVTGLVRDASRYQVRSKVIELADIRTISVEQLVGIDVVIHTAGIAHNKLKNDIEYQQVNVEASGNLALRCIEAGVTRLIFISSTKAVGETSIDADTVPAPKTPYGKSKHQAECLLQKLTIDSPLELVILRIPLVVGLGAGGNLFKLIKLSETRIPLPIKNLSAVRSYLSMDNLLDFAVLSLDHGKVVTEPLLLADTEAISLPALVSAIRTHRKQSIRLFSVPQLFSSALARILLKPNFYNILFSTCVIDAGRTTALTRWRPKRGTLECIPHLLGKDNET